ncbi:UDP-glucosyltransferase 2-like [Hermetia illucens]|uniref:UDP-glucosyltransferase 2-like n=1 Tax=Hermetia illucens TaxID=343691 RepID=UPI0018CC03AA|nr:UDP-glucosyltransferase 2-like [Hermetia illucens]
MQLDFRFLYFIFYFYGSVGCANILYLAGVASPSHGLWNFRLIEALADQGHNLTVLSVDKSKKPIKNAHIIDMQEIYSMVYESEQYDLDEFIETDVFSEIHSVFEFMYKFCKASGKTEGFKALLRYPDNFKFDLVIHDFTLVSCLAGFLHKFNYPPLINVSPYKYVTPQVEAFGGHFYSSYIPRATAPYNVNMTFMQRTENLIAEVYEMLYRKYIFQPKFDKMVSSFYNIKNLPSGFDLSQKGVLTFLNIHPAMDFPVPLAPSVIEVGGLQISDPKPLPSDLENFIKNSTKGSVLISFGTNVRSDLFGDEKQKMVMDVARKFPDYNFLWKFEKDPSNGKLPNLLVKTWLPQNDILAHPKMKAFVSHGGGLSTQEATWHGVPLVAVPFFLDQNTNAYNSIMAGVATYVDIRKITTKDLEEAVRAVLEEPSYAERMKLRSFRFRNRPMKPLDTALWWIDYILKDPNPTHLRSPVIDLGYFKANSFDLILYAFTFLIFLYCVTRYFITYLFKVVNSTTLTQKMKLN